MVLIKQMAGMELEDSKWKKLFGVLKKFLAKEFLWALFSLLMALPLASVTVYLLDTYANSEIRVAMTDLLDNKPIYTGAYVVNLAGIYFSRTVIGAIKTLTTKKAQQ